MNYGKIINGIQQIYNYWMKLKNILFPKFNNQQSHQMVLGKDNTYHVKKPSHLKIRMKQIIAWCLLVIISCGLIIILLHVLLAIILILVIWGIVLLILSKKGK